MWITGLQEGGQRATQFFKSHLPMVLGLWTKDNRVKIDRAHGTWRWFQAGGNRASHHQQQRKTGSSTVMCFSLKTVFSRKVKSA